MLPAPPAAGLHHIRRGCSCNTLALPCQLHAPPKGAPFLIALLVLRHLRPLMPSVTWQSHCLSLYQTVMRTGPPLKKPVTRR